MNTKSTRDKNYTWKPDLVDFRNYPYQTVPVPVATHSDLRPVMPPVFDQGQEGSCTANAGIGLMEFLELKDKKVFTQLSRQFLYYFERYLEGTVNQDAGASISDCMKALAKYGASTEALWPYLIPKMKTKPSAAAIKDGLTRKIVTYTSLRGIDDIKNCLLSGFPVDFGFSVYTSFESSEVAASGIVPMPTKGDQLLGGHSVLAIGHDDAKQWVICRNSWGPDWGVKGDFFLPYGYFTKGLASDFWTIRW